MDRQVQLCELLPKLVSKGLRESASLIQMPCDLIHVVLQPVNISEFLFDFSFIVNDDRKLFDPPVEQYAAAKLGFS